MAHDGDSREAIRLEGSPYRGQARYARSVAQERVSAVLALEVSAKRTSNTARGAEKTDRRNGGREHHVGRREDRPRARPVQKHKRTQDWRAGPFRSSSPRGEPQIWGVSEAISAIRVLRTRRENTVQQRDTTLPGPHLDQNVLTRCAAVAPASILDPLETRARTNDEIMPAWCRQTED